MTTQPDASILEFHQGDRMRKALQFAGLTVDEMAEYLGVSSATLSRWMNQRTPIKLAMVRLWALRTGVRREWLETGQGPALEPGPDGGASLPRLDSNQQPSGYVYAQVSELSWAA